MSNTVELEDVQHNTGSYKCGDIFVIGDSVHMLVENEGKMQMIDLSEGCSTMDNSIVGSSSTILTRDDITNLFDDMSWKYLGSDAKITISFGE
jgi:hypothetical protein